MKRSKLAAAAMAALALAPSVGIAADRTYDLPPFTAIDISSGVDAVVTVGGAQKVAVTAPQQTDIDELKVEVQEGTLKVWRDWDILELFEGFRERETRLTVSAPALTTASASAGADVSVSGLSGETIKIEASSGADLQATDIQATNIEAEASSGADVSANGTCASVVARASSGADLDLRDLACTNANADASSGSDITLSVNGTLKANASSGSDIKVRGTPTTSEIEESSGGEVELGE
jgi:hypothetical protein